MKRVVVHCSYADLLAAIDRDPEHEQDKQHSDGRGREPQTPLADDQRGIGLGEHQGAVERRVPGRDQQAVIARVRLVSTPDRGHLTNNRWREPSGTRLVRYGPTGQSPRMEMRQVRYFLAVADTLNFTRAAERCHVSQPALTRAIQQLEGELGGLLLRRERKLTHLTDFGRLIEPHLRQLAADAEVAKTTAKKFLDLQQAQVRLGVMCTVGPARFMGFLAGFRSANPGCEITLVEGPPPRLTEMLLAACRT